MQTYIAVPAQFEGNNLMPSEVTSQLPETHNANVSVVTCAAQTEGEQVFALLKNLQQKMHDGHPVAVNAGEVRRVSTLGLQVLAAAKASANLRGLRLDIHSPTPEFQRACADSGLSEFFGIGG
jgi:anti-anti-sigma regulatory factor